jgi:hypothetical protein
VVEAAAKSSNDADRDGWSSKRASIASSKEDEDSCGEDGVVLMRSVFQVKFLD